MVKENFLEKVSCEERLKVRREVEGININDSLSHFKLDFSVAKPKWLQQQMKPVWVNCGSAPLHLLSKT